MSKELAISVNRHETKVAILEDDQLVEVHFQRAHEYSLAGSIHKGRVTRVLPGMQSAFVDVGLERDTFLYVSDFFEENEEIDRVSVGGEEPRTERASRAQAGSPTSNDSVPAAKLDTEAPVPSALAAPPSAAPERPRGPEGRDDRGRRSRRRRGRGHGFPESKYAAEVARPARPAEPSVAVERAASEPASEPTRELIHAGEEREFSVLPGESLAKYSRLNVQPLDEEEEAEIRAAQEDAPVEHGSSPAEQDSSFVEPAPEHGSNLVAEGGSGFVEPAPFAGTDGNAEEEPASNVAQDVGGAGAATAAATAAASEPSTPAPSEESAAAAAEAAEAGADDEPAPVDLAAASEEQPPPVVHPTPQLSAQVREHGGRSMHRVPRRMRRKMRMGGPPEGKPGDERRGEPPSAGAAAAEAPVVRPEPPRSVARPDKAPLPSIAELLKEGQEIIVQIAKEPLGQKGARITSHIALPGRFVVYMPTLEHTGVSRRIASDEERHRLKKILQIHHAGIPGGYIVRTAGEGKSEEELAADMNFLFNLWLDIRQKAEKRPAPVLLHHDLDIVQRLLRDQLTEQFKAIWVDNEEVYESVLRFVQRFQPSLVNRVKLYTRPEPIFDAFNITAELEKALRPKVWLKSGGYIVINQTEALVAIDVNTGKYVGRSNRLEDTIVKTNTEAVKEIVRQIRLRDLGGIIVVDFIDMDERKNRQKVMQTLEDAMRADRAPNKILQFNDFGLVAITRKRVKQSLERALCMPCPHCEGAGYVKSLQTIVGEILQEAHKIASSVEREDIILRVHPDVAKVLKSNHNKYLEELEEILRHPVLVRSDPMLHHEKFDLA